MHSYNGSEKALWKIVRMWSLRQWLHQSIVDCDLQTMALYNCCLNLHFRQWFCLVFNKPLSELQAVLKKSTTSKLTQNFQLTTNQTIHKTTNTNNLQQTTNEQVRALKWIGHFGLTFSEILHMGATRIAPLNRSGALKWINKHIAPPIDSPNKNLGRCCKCGLFVISDQANTISIYNSCSCKHHTFLPWISQSSGTGFTVLLTASLSPSTTLAQPEE